VGHAGATVDKNVRGCVGRARRLRAVRSVRNGN
jgi:hypothetical protein